MAHNVYEYELWVGKIVDHQDGGKEKNVAVVSCDRNPFLFVVNPEWIDKLVVFEGEDYPEQEESQAQAVTVAMAFHATAADMHNMSPVQWNQILDRRVAAEWEIPVAMMDDCLTAYYEMNPHLLPSEPTKH